MLILTIRSDKPDAEIGLFNNSDQLGYEVWAAHRALAETIHTKIETLLVAHNQTLQSLGGVVVFKGPGSFTGLRISLTVANALVDSLGLPIAASDGDRWIKSGIERLLEGQNDQLAVPEYGALPNITAPRK
jgi:tRNA threonylcarbamoyladenosine biosynthesis protein TsaB